MSLEDSEKNKISLLDSYDAMVEFIERYYEIGMRKSDDISAMISSITRHDENGGYPFDASLWNEYMDIAYAKGSISVK